MNRHKQPELDYANAMLEAYKREVAHLRKAMLRWAYRAGEAETQIQASKHIQAACRGV